MVTVKIEATSKDLVELVQVLALIEVYAPEKAKRARNKLSQAIKDGISELEFEEFQKAVDKFIKNGASKRNY